MDFENIKLKIAYLLDKLFPKRYCWGDLVLWAKYIHEWSDVKRPRDCNYCGKCQMLKPHLEA